MWSVRVLFLGLILVTQATKGHAQTENGVAERPGTYALPYTPEIPEKFHAFGKDIDYLLPRLSRMQFVRMDLTRKFPFFDTPYQTLYPNTNGAITFDRGNADVPTNFTASLDFKIIAAYWGHMVADNCRVSDGLRSRGDIFVRETEDPTTLQNITRQIRTSMPGETRFTARWALVFTVYQTRMPVSSSWNCRNPWTTYQTILTTDGIKSFVVFLYHQMGASSNYCDHRPAGGINAGDGKRSYMLPMSSSGGYGNFSETLMAHSNVGIPGTWLYRVDQENVTDTRCAEDGSNFQISPRFGSLLGGTKVTVAGLCVDKDNHSGNITCRIGGAYVAAKVTATNEFTCVTPVGVFLGSTAFAVALDGSDFRYQTNFTYDYITTDVVIHNEEQLNNGSASTFNLTWEAALYPPEENVTVQLVIWITTSPTNLTDPVDFLPAWAVQEDDPQLLVISIVTAQNGPGHAEVPSSQIISSALPPNSIPTSGFFRVVSTRDAAAEAEQGGHLFSSSLVSGIKFVGRMWLNDLGSQSAASSLSKQTLQLPSYLKQGWQEFKRATPCLVKNTAIVAWEAYGTDVLTRLGGGRNSKGKIAPVAFMLGACKAYSVYTEFESKAAPFLGCFFENNARKDRGLEIRLPTRPCPATLAQALRDSGRYMPSRECRMGSTDPSNCLWNKGATHCVLTPMTAQAIASQCCYSSSGNLVDNTNAEAPGGQLEYLPFGLQQTENFTANRMMDFGKYKDSTFAKWYNGITAAATAICCVGARDLGMCKSLLEHFRPTGSRGYNPPRPAITSGDPHITTFDDCDYTFNGLGEYTVVSIPNTMNVQGRTKKTDDGRATVWQAVALQGIGGTTVHVQYNELSGLEVFVDHAQLDLTEGADSIRYPDLTIHQEAGKSALEITLNNGAAVEVKRLTKHLDIIIYLPDSAKGHARGLFGSWHVNGSKDLYAPDDRVFSCNSSAETLFEFGNQWRVIKAQSLFTYRTGESYELFNDLQYRPAFEPVPMNATMDLEAKEFCGASRQCYFDYVVTGDRELAADTAQSFHEFDQILVDTAPVVSCGFSRPGDNAIIISVNNSYLEGDIVKFKCAENSIKLSGKEEVQCRSDGTWSGTALTCGVVPQVSCGPKNPGQNATIVSTGNTFAEGDVLRYQCLANHTKSSGQEELRCQSNGAWNGDALTCRAMASCGPKPPGQNAVIVSQNNTLLEGDTLKFQCTEDKTKKTGKEEIKCQTDGTWDGDALTCSACRLFRYAYLWVMLYFVLRRSCSY